MCSLPQQLGVETLGQVVSFKAMPGFGLSAQVTDVKHLLKTVESSGSSDQGKLFV